MSSAAGLVALPWHAAYSASKYGLRGLSEVLRFDLARHRIGVSVVVPGAVKTPLVQTVQIAGVDREDPNVQKWTDRFGGHAVSPEHVADRDPARRASRTAISIYTSPDIRALYMFKRDDVVALQRGDAAGQRALHPRAAPGEAAWLALSPVPGRRREQAQPLDPGLAEFLVQLDLHRGAVRFGVGDGQRCRGIPALRSSG